MEYRMVTKEEAKKIASDFECKYFEVSAKTGSNIKPLFSEIVKDIAQISTTKDSNGPNEPGGSLTIQPQSQSNANVTKCC